MRHTHETPRSTDDRSRFSASLRLIQSCGRHTCKMAFDGVDGTRNGNLSEHSHGVKRPQWATLRKTLPAIYAPLAQLADAESSNLSC